MSERFCFFDGVYSGLVHGVPLHLGSEIFFHLRIRYRVQGSVIRVSGSGFRDSGLEFQGQLFRIRDFGFGIPGCGIRDLG